MHAAGDGRARCAGAVAVALAVASGEGEVAVRDGVVWVPRLSRVTAASASVSVVGSGDGVVAPWGVGTVLVTGAFGGLGRVVVRHLVERHGVQDLLLVSRRGAEAEGAVELQASLGELGVGVRVAACDVADRAALATLLAEAGGGLPRWCMWRVCWMTV